MPTDILLFVYIFFGITATLFGIVIGSFLNVVIYRVPAGRTIVKGHSMCMSCGHQLASKDLVPLFSWLFLRGKCRYCGAPVASRYAKIESLTGGLFLVSALTHLDASLFIILQNCSSAATFAMFVMFIATLCILVSAMMIWYDTGKAFIPLALIPVVFALGSCILDYARSGCGWSVTLIAFLIRMTLIASFLLICFVISTLARKKYALRDLLLDMSFAGAYAFSAYTLFTADYLQIPVSALSYAIFRTALRNTRAEKYSGIIGCCSIVTLIVLRYFIVKPHFI